jgi:hypothetical protein
MHSETNTHTIMLGSHSLEAFLRMLELLLLQLCTYAWVLPRRPGVMKCDGEGSLIVATHRTLHGVTPPPSHTK